MSKKLRSINTRIWDDAWVSELTPEQKLIWIYLLTNPLCNLVGIYEITPKRIAFDTGIQIGTVRKALELFEKAKKAFYTDDHILLVNFYANQSMNANMKVGAINCFNELPENIQNKVLGNGSKGFETLRNGLQMVRKSEVEYEVEVESEYECEVEKEVEVEKKRNEKEIELFENFRQAYPGTKRGLQTEWQNFKKHKDWKEVLPMLAPELKRQYHARQENQKNGTFVPEWKHLKTYINNRAWEEEIIINQNTNNNGAKKGNNSQGGVGAGFDLQKAYAYIDEMYERREAGSDGDSDSGEAIFDL